MNGDFIESLFFSNLAKCLSSASNLRDLRYSLLRWSFTYYEDLSLFDVVFISQFDVEKEWPNGYVLSPALRPISPEVSNKTDERRGTDPHQMILHPHFLVPFVTKMTRLVCLCLVGFDCDPSEVQQLNQRFTREILPNRPEFWFYVGPQLPEGNDQTVPRVHYDEIICPIDAFRAPPIF